MANTPNDQRQAASLEYYLAKETALTFHFTAESMNDQFRRTYELQKADALGINTDIAWIYQCFAPTIGIEDRVLTASHKLVQHCVTLYQKNEIKTAKNAIKLVGSYLAQHDCPPETRRRVKGLLQGLESALDEPYEGSITTLVTRVAAAATDPSPIVAHVARPTEATESTYAPEHGETVPERWEPIIEQKDWKGSYSFSPKDLTSFLKTGSSTMNPVSEGVVTKALQRNWCGLNLRRGPHKNYSFDPSNPPQQIYLFKTISSLQTQFTPEQNRRDMRLFYQHLVDEKVDKSST